MVRGLGERGRIDWNCIEQEKITGIGNDATNFGSLDERENDHFLFLIRQGK